MIPYSESRILFKGRELTLEEKSVRGTLISGLNQEDVNLLDTFEGDEYTRETVLVHPLNDFVPLLDNDAHDSDIVPFTPSDIPSLDSLKPPISAQTYIWIGGVHLLKPDLWNYAEFVRENARHWVGKGAEDQEDYIEVDKRRQMNGNIVHNEIVNQGGELKVVRETTIGEVL